MELIFGSFEYRSTQRSCVDFSQRSRDDDTPAGKNMFYVLFGVFLLCLIFAFVVAFLTLQRRMKKQKSLQEISVMYTIGILTLIGK